MTPDGGKEMDGSRVARTMAALSADAQQELAERTGRIGPLTTVDNIERIFGILARTELAAWPLTPQPGQYDAIAFDLAMASWDAAMLARLEEIRDLWRELGEAVKADRDVPLWASYAVLRAADRAQRDTGNWRERIHLDDMPDVEPPAAEAAPVAQYRLIFTTGPLRDTDPLHVIVSTDLDRATDVAKRVTDVVLAAVRRRVGGDVPLAVDVQSDPCSRDALGGMVWRDGQWWAAFSVEKLGE